MSKILIYTFYAPHQITYKLVSQLNLDVTKYYVGSIQKLIDMVKTNPFDYVIGLGDYRKDAKYIRIETNFQNKYGKSLLVGEGVSNLQPTWIPEVFDGTALSTTLTNGPCNRSAYLVLHAIKINNLLTKFMFVHIPSSANIKSANHTLLQWIHAVE